MSQPPQVPVSIRVLDDRLLGEFSDGSGKDLRPATMGSAGSDLKACIDETLTLNPGESELIASGFCMEISDPSFAAIIIPKSGKGHKKGLVVGNLVGLIDYDYQGQVMISAWNRSNTPIQIEPGQEIAQLVLVRVAQIAPDFVDELPSEATERGDGGFGSTG